ncbi:Rid family detoxifying hydrolase [uncultured Chitinophaga sp.]|uniref:Rid family detoxifying hydrolase n=1 Tax=uncultured Chitinophaga sp. TaxID=339340 RepID=UPI0025E8C6E7|nr:Rid family detoxifying hydrolase [uncultured Chitinophaga sp.]
MKQMASLLLLILLTSCAHTQKIKMKKHANLPTPIGPYSHSTSFGNLIFISGQIGIDPRSNVLKEGIREQLKQIFDNLEVILKDNHSDFEHIAKTTIFLTDLKAFGTVNEIYSRYFHQHYPARSTIEVALLPRNASIEIECIAVRKAN